MATKKDEATGLPVIALDPLADVVAFVELGGIRYPVSPVSAVGYERSQAVLVTMQEGRQVEPGALFKLARSLVKTMPQDVADGLEPRQAVAILLAAVQQVNEVETLFPKAPRAGSSRKTSRRGTP
jgi:hypothetical protein